MHAKRSAFDPVTSRVTASGLLIAGLVADTLGICLLMSAPIVGAVILVTGVCLLLASLRVGKGSRGQRAPETTAR